MIEVYTNENEPWYGVLVSEGTQQEAERAVQAECLSELPITYLGIRVEPILNENGRPGRRRRFYVFTDEPASPTTPAATSRLSGETRTVTDE